MSKKEEPKFEAQLERLDEIVQNLESGEVPLDRAIELFEEGTHLSKQCSKLLDKVETRIGKLLDDTKGIEEFTDAEEDE